MKNLLISYAINDWITAQDVGAYNGEQACLPPLDFMKRELKFTAIEGLKYYPSAETTDVITFLAASADKDIEAAAKRTLKALMK
ncbi:MAG: hypothetical protein ACI4TK_06175 [Agathobacter sp.]